MKGSPFMIYQRARSLITIGAFGLLILLLAACGGGTTQSNLTPSSTTAPAQATPPASTQSTGGGSKTCPVTDTLHNGTFTNVVITLPPGCVVNFVVTKIGHFKAGFPNQTPGDYKFSLGKSFISNIGGTTDSETITANFTGSYQIVPFSQRACDPANC
jgi:hypothetical protein